jgi:DNA-3-methyladenine glycosylase II
VELVGGPARRRAARLRAQRLLERVLGTRHELRAFYRALGGDPLLAAAIRQSRGLSIAGFGDLFEALVTAILTQQVNLIFAYSIRDELVGAFGRRARLDGEVRYAFPEPARLARAPLERLRGMRLSGAKALALQGVARAFTRGELSEAALEALDDEQAIARLCELRGVGRWTAETALIRGLGRRDVFPAGDLGVIKYLAQGLLGRDGRAPEAEMRAFAERWRPYRAYALVYAYAELARRRRP